MNIEEIWNNFNKEKSCVICYDDITKEECIIGKTEKMGWQLVLMCKSCFDESNNLLWTTYVKQLKTVDCERTLKNMLSHECPKRMTIDGSLFGESLNEIYSNDEYSIPSINIPKELNIIEFDKRVNKIYENFINGVDLDYMSNLKKLFEDFSL